MSDQSDAEELRRLICELEALQARVARSLRKIRELRALAGDHVELSAKASAPPMVMTALPPVTPPPRRRGRGKKTLAREKAENQPQKYYFPLSPCPLELRDGEVICQYGSRTIRLPLRAVDTRLSNGLIARVHRLATTRFANLAVHAVVEIAPKPRLGRRKKERGSDGDAVSARSPQGGAWRF
jgi:hypothetical protein